MPTKDELEDENERLLAENERLAEDNERMRGEFMHLNRLAGRSGMLLQVVNLLDSMVESGEKHSPVSTRLVQDAKRLKDDDEDAPSPPTPDELKNMTKEETPIRTDDVTFEDVNPSLLKSNK